MRMIKEIIIHCSATKEDKDYTIADIDRWHRECGFRKLVIFKFGGVVNNDYLCKRKENYGKISLSY